MDNYSKSQLINLPLIQRFLSWIRRERETMKTPEGGENLFRIWVRDNGGLDESGNIDKEWAAEKYDLLNKKLMQDTDSIPTSQLQVLKMAHRNLKNFLTAEYPEAMFE
jgi:hypothetical protein